jgi:apolipoprotein D and lipocalin family protein
MKTKNALIYGGIAAAAAAATAYFTLRCTRSMKPAGAHTVSNFNLQKYLGKWYEIARIDFKHEKNLSNTSAEYTLNEDGTVGVINKGYNDVKGEWESATGKAKFRGSANVGELKVSFFGPFYAGYNVLAVDADYQYALVAGEDTFGFLAEN